MKDRLTRADWLKHGMLTLAKDGPNALKVGPMSGKLKVSRGSFYWHFRDIADFRAQLLQVWQERSTDRVIQDLDNRAETDRLKHLLTRGFVGKRRLDRAIRSWAAEDAEVAALVAAVDARRVGYVATMLIAVGVDPGVAAHRAAFLYWAYLGQPVVMEARHASIPPSAMEDISALFQR